MKSIKPGRGPSMMGGIMSIVTGIFGVIWTVAASSMGEGFIALLGVVFIVIAVAQAIYNFKNATSQNRYSAFDITDEKEEPDPFNERFGAKTKLPQSAAAGSSFCPYCGNRVSESYEFCNKCGKKLP